MMRNWTFLDILLYFVYFGLVPGFGSAVGYAALICGANAVFLPRESVTVQAQQRVRYWWDCLWILLASAFVNLLYEAR